MKHGKRVTRNFLELQPEIEGADEMIDMLRHDSEVDIIFKQLFDFASLRITICVGRYLNSGSIYER